MRIGVLGGTFDPIHIGHLIAASEVHTALQLDSVWFMPAGQPWQKADRTVTDAKTRYEMTKLATSHDQRFVASDLEIRRSGPTYSIDTVDEIHSIHPDAQLFWIVGTDVAARIPTWHRWEDFVSAVTVVVVNRPDASRLDGLPFSYETVEMPAVRISATRIRERYAKGITCKYLVPEAVDNYVVQHRLYAE